MATIAKLSVMLSANTAAFTTGMTAAGRHTKKFAASMSSISSTALKMGGALAALAGVGGMAMLIEKTRNSIDETAKLSDRLGITTEALIGLRHAADLSGVGNEEFNVTLEKMVRILGDAAAMGKGPTVDALANIGLAADDLVNMAPDEAMRKIADGIAGVKNPAMQASIAVDLFGKAGQKMISVLSGGSAALDAARKDAELLGMMFTRIDAAKVEMANDAFTRLQGVISGIAQQFVIQLAPVITEATNRLVAFATAGNGVRANVGTAIEYVAMAIGRAADVLEVFKAGFYAFQGVAMTAGQGVYKSIALLATAMDSLLVSLGQASTGFGKSFDRIAMDVGMDAAAAFKMAGESLDEALDLKNTQGVMDFFSDARKKAEAAAKLIADGAAAATTEPLAQMSSDVTKILDKLQEEFATLNMNEAEKFRRQLEGLGASEEQIAMAVAMRTEIEAVTEAREKEKKMMEDMEAAAASVFEATRTDMEKREAELTRLSDLLNAGAIDWDTYSRAVKQANEALKKTGSTVPENPAAQVVRFTQGMPSGARPMSELEKINKQQVDLQKKQLDTLKRIDSKTTMSGGGVVIGTEALA